MHAPFCFALRGGRRMPPAAEQRSAPASAKRDACQGALAVDLQWEIASSIAETDAAHKRGSCRQPRKNQIWRSPAARAFPAIPLRGTSGVRTRTHAFPTISPHSASNPWDARAHLAPAPARLPSARLRPASPQPTACGPRPRPLDAAVPCAFARAKHVQMQRKRAQSIENEAFASPATPNAAPFRYTGTRTRAPRAQAEFDGKRAGAFSIWTVAWKPATRRFLRR